MKITIELFAGAYHVPPTKRAMQKNIEALDRAIAGKMLSCDDVLLMDTRTILQGIQDKLKE